MCQVSLDSCDSDRKPTCRAKFSVKKQAGLQDNLDELSIKDILVWSHQAFSLVQKAKYKAHVFMWLIYLS